MSADIEGYRERNRHYPISLQSSLGDWDRRVMGIDRYRYEPSGAAYNLFFELPSNEIGTQEFVVYNPLDEQQMSAHDADRLQLSVEDQNRMRGYRATRDAGRPHWKSFYFD